MCRILMVHYENRLSGVPVHLVDCRGENNGVRMLTHGGSTLVIPASLSQIHSGASWLSSRPGSGRGQDHHVGLRVRLPSSISR